jgi:flagellin
VLSVNANHGASLALQALNATNKELEGVQGRINTGLKVASAMDNGAVFAIAQGQRGRLNSLTSVKDGIDRASSTLDVALAAGNAISDILQHLKSKAVNAQAEDLTSDQRSALQADFDAYRAQIAQIAGSAQFNGLNLINSGGANLNVAISDISSGVTGRQVISTPYAGSVPGLAAYLVGQASSPSTFVGLADGTTFRLNGTDIGTVTLTGSMTVQGYLDAVSTSTGGRVTATYDQSAGTFTYRAPEAVVTTNELTVVVKTGGNAKTWLGHGNAATAVTGGASTMSITDRDWTAGGSGALSTISTAANLLSTAASATTTVGNIDTAINALNVQLASMGAQNKGLDAQSDFISKLKDAVEQGISNLVDADLARESARLQSLQVKQQLGAQALSIANKSPQLILSFFR